MKSIISVFSVLVIALAVVTGIVLAQAPSGTRSADASASIITGIAPGPLFLSVSRAFCATGVLESGSDSNCVTHRSAFIALKNFIEP